jgi:hypothetical protein
MLPKIVKLELLDDYQIHIYLEDGFDFVFNFKPCLDYPCNKELRDISLFKRAKFHMRMIYWDDMHDIHLDQMIPNKYLQKVS